MRAAGVVKRQVTGRALLLRACSQAATLWVRVSASGIRRSRNYALEAGYQTGDSTVVMMDVSFLATICSL